VKKDTIGRNLLKVSKLLGMLGFDHSCASTAFNATAMKAFV
jgi:hypothetical protein